MYFTVVYFILCFNVFTYWQCNGEEVNPCNEKFNLVTDHSHEDCPSGYVFKKTGNGVHDCFSSCVPFDFTKPCSDANPCPPGYQCPKPEGNNVFCKIDDGSCLKKSLQPDNPWEYAWTPTCLPDGSWAAKQCKGQAGNGRCFCYDTKGNRIFGQAFLDKSSNMTCACSRKKVEIRNQGSRFYTTLHCDSMGNYEPLQCDDGQCWCAEPKTGAIISKVVPDTMITLLPCYSKNDTVTNYMRPCESDEYAQKNILYEFNLHGTQQINFPHVMCDDDGNYGNYQIVSGQAYCRWKDNSNIPPYTAGIDENFWQVNCYCARDIKIYESFGATQYLICKSNGNYKPDQYQTIDEKWYCVDEDGFKSSDYFNDKPDCTPYV